MSYRSALRSLLVIVLLGVLGISGWRIWRVTRPEYIWSAAQASLAAEDRPAARLHLQNLLKKQPQNADAYLLLAKVELDEAAAQGKPATYAAQPRALRCLAEAAKLRTDDLKLQKELLGALLSQRRITEGAAVAQRILTVEPNHTDALYVATFHAVESKNLKAAASFIGRLKNNAQRPAFETLGFEVQFAIDTQDEAAKQDAFERFVTATAGIHRDELNRLTPADRRAWDQLAVLAVSHADEIQIAVARSEKMLDGIEHGFGDDVGQAAMVAERLLVTLQQKFPSTDGGIVPVKESVALAARVGKLRTAALNAGKGTAVLAIRAAQDELLAKNQAKAFEILSKGLALATEQKLTAKDNDVAQLHLMLAQLLIGAGKTEEARSQAQELLSNDSFAGWGHLILGNVSLNQGRCDAALPEFRAAEKKLGGTLLVRAALAQTNLMLQKWSDALPLLRSLHVQNEELTLAEREWAKDHLGNGDRVHFDELRAHLALNQWDKARAHLGSLSGTDLEPRAWVLIVGYWLDRNHPDEAMRWLSEGRSRFPHDLELVWIDAVAKGVSGNANAAQELLTKFAADHAQSVPAQLLICRWRMEHGEAAGAANAIAHIRKRKDISPEEHEVLALLEAQALAISGQPELALAKLAPLTARPETAASAGMLAATVQASHKNWEGVQRVLTEVSKVSPDAKQVDLFQAEFAAMRGDYRTALEALGPALDVTELRQRARSAMQQAITAMTSELGPAGALEKVDQLIKLYPRDASLRVTRANLAIQIGDLDGALAALDHLEQLDAASPWGAYYRATTLTAAQQTERALGEAKRAIKIAPTHLPSLLLVAELEIKLNRIDSALQTASVATKLDPTSGPAYLLQAESLNRLGRSDEARTIFKNLVQHVPNFAPGHVGLAALLANRGDFAAAIQACEAGLQVLPGDVSIQACQVSLLAKNGNAVNAVEIARVACGTPVDGLKAIAFAQAFRGAEQTSLADEFLLVAANSESKPARAEAHTTLGMQSLSAGMKTDDALELSAARDHFQAALAADPDQMLAANNLAWLLATKLNAAEEAVTVVEGILNRHTSERLSPELLDTIAMVYRAAHRHQDVASLMEKVIPFYPTDARLYYQLGLAQLDEAKADDCRESLMRALQLGLKGPRAEKAQEILSKLSDLAGNTTNRTASAN
jgi:tetratricopeptide (TPR) repeat protein